MSGIDVEIARPGPLSLTYRVSGAIAKLLLPARTAPARADGLWRRTCFEAFVGTGGGYLELNFSPSSEWAAYRFAGHRAGMAVADDMVAPRIAVSAGAEALEVRVLADLPADAAGPLALTAVIEETGGGLSYWALGHGPGKPDFHHWRPFAIDLP
ncbi:MAG TPA: DOMON-like domain-containing protein [Caulobacteraceae bacterium]